MDFFELLVRYETELWNQLDDDLAAHGMITVAQLEAVRVIAHKNGCRVQDLSTALSITVGAASKLTDRLERDGLATRIPNPADRRSFILELTAEGGTAREQADARATAQVDAHLLDIDVTALTTALTRLRQRLAETRVPA